MSIFSETLIFLRQRNGLTREQLAEHLCVSPSHIKRLETNYISPDEKTIESIADYFSVTAAYLTGGSSRQVSINISEPGFDLSGKFVSVPVSGAENAMKRVISESEILSHIILPMPGNKRCDYVAILIEDDKLGCDRMKKGDTAIVEITNQLSQNDLVAVSYRNEPVFFKKYSRLGPTIILTSDDSFEHITYDISCTDYKIIGKVIGFHGTI